MMQAQPASEQTRKKERRIFFITSGVLWIVACALPAYDDGTSGIECFLTGWLNIADEKYFAFLAWSSNIPWAVAWFMFTNGTRKSTIVSALILTTIALILSFGAFEINTIHHGVFGTGYTAYVDPSYGTYAWIGSYAVLLLGTIVDRFNSPKV